MAKKKTTPAKADPITITQADGITAAEASDAGAVLAQFSSQDEAAVEVELTEAHALEVMFGGPEFASHDLPYSGAAVRYVLHTGPNVGQVRDAVIVELYGETMHLEVRTEPGDSFANPLTLIRVPYSAAKTPGTWHWPVEA